MVLGAIYFLFIPDSDKTTAIDNKKTISEVYNLHAKGIQQIRITYKDSGFQTLTIKKKLDSTWEITTPFIATAENKKLNELIGDFVNKRIKERISVSEYAKYGLENPTIRIELWNDPNNPSKTFFIGDKAINYSVYTKELTEGDIFLIESSALDDLSKSPSDLRSRSVLSFDPKSITEIHYIKPEGFSCKKDGDKWKIIHPLSVDADSQTIDYILTELQSLQVKSFEADDVTVIPVLDKYGLDSPRIQLSLTDGKKKHGIDIGSDVPNDTEQDSTEKGYVYVKSHDHGGIFTVSRKIIQLLEKTLFDLRNKRIVDFERGDTIKFEIEHGPQRTIGIKLGENSWELQGTDKIKADSRAVSDLIFGVDSLEAVAFETNPDKNLVSYGLDPPITRVKFTIRGVARNIELHIGRTADDNTVFVKTYTSQQITRVKRDLIDKIAKGVAWLRDKHLFNFNINDPTRLTINYDDLSQESGLDTFTCQRLGSNWRLTLPVKEDANNSAVNDMLYDLIDLKVAEYLTTTELDKIGQSQDTTGLDEPTIQITIVLRDQKSYTLQIGNEDRNGNYYANFKTQPTLVFIINASVIPDLKVKLEWLRIQEKQ